MKNKVCRTLLVAVARVFGLLFLMAAGLVSHASTAYANTILMNVSGTGPGSQRYCVRHRHGDYWHSCSDTRHPEFDQAHFHTGLPAYYPAAGLSQSNGFYIGIKSGSITIDVAQSDVGMPKGVVMGFGWIEYALELEASSASISTASSNVISPGELTGFDSGYTTTAIYGVRRIGGAIYTKMKVGLSRSRYDVDGEKQRGSGVSAGIGVGLRIGALFLEGEYTYLGSDARFFSIGANIGF